jgi:BASS family bile acid:Na+ symporter
VDQLRYLIAPAAYFLHRYLINPIYIFSHFVHRHFIWFVLASYAVASFSPGLGLWIRGVSFGDVALFGQKTTVTLPVMMLALLLFNAGLGVQTSRLRNLAHHPLLLLAGLAGNLVIPLGFILVVSQVMNLWHNPDEVQNILVGLALVASMPIAGSSTAWSQNANGDLALSLGLVLGSTLVSPLTTTVVLHTVGLLTTGDYSEDLHELAADNTGIFLGIAVILPSLLGIGVRRLAGETRIDAAKPLLKLFNSVNLLLLNYSNASVSLPQTIADPDWDFLAVTLGIVVALCVLAFAAGWWLGRSLKGDAAQQAALMFGLGMNNNGTGLVLASMALADHPRVLLAIIFYNLVQHLVAACVDALICRRQPAPSASG